MPHSLGPILEEEKIDGAISVAFTLTATCHGSCCVDPLEDDSETDCLKPHFGRCMGYMILDVGGEMAASHHLACGPAGPNCLLYRGLCPQRDPGGAATLGQPATKPERALGGGVVRVARSREVGPRTWTPEPCCFPAGLASPRSAAYVISAKRVAWCSLATLPRGVPW